MGKPNEVKMQFAEFLKQALTRHFGELPSNAAIAREFNLRAHGSDPVTQESVRRWVKGVCMPDERKLKILVSWLDLDLKQCFQEDSANPSSHNGDQRPVNTKPVTPGVLAAGYGVRRDQVRILRLLDALSQSDKQLVERLARKLSSARPRG